MDAARAARAEPVSQHGGRSGRGGSRRASLDADTAKDMADIDSRLLALQKFLMSAKGT